MGGSILWQRGRGQLFFVQVANDGESAGDIESLCMHVFDS